MRLFEILLLVVVLPVILWPLLPWKRPRWLDWLAGTAVLAAVLHFFIEGYRWQMLPAYTLAGILVLLAFGRRGREVGRKTAVFGGLAGLFVWLIAVALPILLPVPRPTAPTGPYGVGTATFYLRDDSRPEIYTPDPDDKREVMAQLWYPANPAPHAEPAPYLDNLDVTGPAIARQFDLPAFLFDHINLTQTNSYPDAPMAVEAAPVIVFSHGLTGFRGQNTTMAQELASHGYVVAAMDHTYASGFAIFPDGRVIIYDPCRIFTDCRSNPQDGVQLVSQWADDIGFLLDEMARWNETAGHPFYGRFDLSSVGVFGHSTGGGTAVEFCRRDARCQAGLGLDAWVLPVSEAILDQPLTQPFMFINTPVWLGPDNAARGQTIYNDVQNDAYLLSIANTKHFDFSDLPLFSPLTPQLGLTGAINSKRAVAIQNYYALAFFDQYLRGKEGLTSASVFEEVTFASH